MRRFFAYGLTIVLLAACSTQEKDFQTPVQEDVIYYASFERPNEEGTRVYANEDLLLRWTADDRVSIFGKNTYNQQYKFLGETGDNSGGFSKVDGAEYVTGNPISHTVSVYPYQASTKITEDEVLTVTLPAEQTYAENTFGLGANTMVSVSEDNFLQYKNVGGYLVIKLYGEGVSVSSITLKGNNSEKLAGNATVSMPVDGDPSVSMASDASTEITLTCETPVQLGATAEESTDFWFVVPPVKFSEGFSIIVSSGTGLMTKTTEKSLSIERNNLSKMAPIKVTPLQPNNVIYYTSTEKSVIPLPEWANGFGANVVSNEYVGGVGIITFDGDVTGIGEGSFMSCASLASISLPRSLTSIGESVFHGCKSLASIVIPDSVTSMGEGVFYGCSSLTDVTLPNSLTDLSPLTFVSCSSLSHINLPMGLTSIGASAFSGCSSLSDLSLPDGLLSVGASAFSGCTSLSGIVFPNGLTSIGAGAFNECTSLTSIMIPNSVTTIEAGSFSGCTSLSSFGGRFATSDGLFLIDQGRIIAIAIASIHGSITIPDEVTSIGESAFKSCTGLTSIILPEGITSIDYATFSNCTGLSDITLPRRLTSIGSSAFNGCTSLTSIMIPESVTSIGSLAFNGCTNLASMVIPEGVTILSSSVFQNCTSLSSVHLPESLTSIEPLAFSYCSSLESINIPESVFSIGLYAFRGCSSLSEINLPGGLSEIKSGTFFDCSGLTSITIPDGIWEIEAAAFRGCTSLTNITLPGYLNSIGNSAFQGCSGLTSMTIPLNVRSLGRRVFMDCTSLTSVTVICETPPSAGADLFTNTNNCPIYVPAESIVDYQSADGWAAFADRFQAVQRSNNVIYYTSWGSVVEPYQTDGFDAVMVSNVYEYGRGVMTFDHDITRIGDNAFKDCQSFRSIVLPGSITTIGNEAFRNCSSISSITIPEGVTQIGDNAFSGVKMWKFELPASVSSLGSTCFDGIVCVVLPSTSPISIQADTFEGVYGIYVPAGMVATYATKAHWTNYSSRLYPMDAYREKTEFTLATSGAVDMGTSVKWAAYNVGATKPEEFGDYFAWGETQPKTDYSWSTYQWSNGYSSSLTKYCNDSNYGDNGFTDNKTVLDLEDDAAHANLGGAWRMPTEEEWAELWERCYWEWDYVNDADGYMFYDLNGGNLLFLPVAGFRAGTTFTNSSSGNYWSSSLDTDRTYRALRMRFQYNEVNSHQSTGRANGLSVRPVTE